jgi:hypothetical protein
MVDDSNKNPGGGSRPPTRGPLENVVHNVNPNEPPHQEGTDSQGWTDRDTIRREKFKQIHGAKDEDFSDGDQRPTAPDSNKP